MSFFVYASKDNYKNNTKSIMFTIYDSFNMSVDSYKIHEKVRFKIDPKI